MATNTMVPRFLLLLLLFVTMASSADLLQNADFESPPLNLPKNSTSSLAPLSENSTIPGWTFQGNIQYVRSSETLKLPNNGHAIQLGQDGKINQTFTADANAGTHYILTFNLVNGGQNCSKKADLVVSSPDSRGVFGYKEGYGKEKWQSYGHYLGLFGGGQIVNVVFESQTVESDSDSDSGSGSGSDSDSVCWPIVDTLLVKTVAATLVPDSENLISNGGFEIGPDFLIDSTDGILIEESPSPILSAIREWSTIGTIKYINSKNFHVPNGKSAIEILSGSTSGIQTATSLTIQNTRYNLTFTLADANDGCKGELLVGVQAGSAFRNFTIESSGKGSDQKQSVEFVAEEQATEIGFRSYTTIRTDDGVYCGPVVDDVVLLRVSGGIRSEKFAWIVFFLVSAIFYTAVF